MPISEEAKKLIADSIAIVREDRFETFVRGKLNPPVDPKNPPPPEKEPPAPKPKKGLWWSELETEEPPKPPADPTT